MNVTTISLETIWGKAIIKIFFQTNIIQLLKNNIMTYSIIQVSTFWTSDSLIEKVEETLNKKAKEGYEVVTVSFERSRYWRIL